MKTRNRWRLASLALLLAVTGCGGPLVNASGKVTYKGQPVPSTYVTFQPKEEGQRASTGLTDDDGRFELQYSRTEPGVLRGQHTVFLTYYVSVEEELGKIAPKASPELKAVIARYGDAKKSPLRYEIKTNGQFIEIQLE